MTRAHLQLLVATIAGLAVLGAPLVLLVRAMRRDERRARLTNAPVAGLLLLGAVSVGAWLWIALTDVQINARIQGPLEAFLLALAAIGIYLLWLAIPVAAATWLVFRLQDPALHGRLARGGITAAGIVAAIAGVYFAFLTAGAIWDFILLVRALSQLPGGQAGIPILIAGFFSFLFVVVLGSVTGLLMLIAAWGLEPRRRWREWRIPSHNRVLVIAFAAIASSGAAGAQELPVYLRDRGTGVKASQFGTYIRDGELLVYPFFEWYYDSNLEYKPSDFGFVGGQDFRGRYHASEGLLWFGYGVGPDLALEVEAAVITARLQKSPQDLSAMPSELKQSGLGDVEAQVRWRIRRETQSRPELFTFFETVFPFQKRKKLIGTPNYELKLGFGATRGGRSGTWTVRAAAEYNAEERKLEPGEYAIEYLKRISPTWRVVALIEGNQVDEVELITEVQWRFHPRATLKLNNGLGLTPNATDIAPEIGIMFAF